MHLNKYKISLIVVLCLVLTIILSLPTYANTQTTKTAPVDVAVSPEVEQTVDSASTNSADVLIELNDYSIEDLANTTKRNSLKNDVENISDDLNLDQNSTTSYSRIPVVATKIDAEQLDELRNDSRVKSVTLQRRYSVEDLKDTQTGMKSLDQATSILNADGAWTNSTPYTGAGQKIVIADTGVDKTHPFLAGAVVQELCFAKGQDEEPTPNPNVGSCSNGKQTQSGNGSAAPCAISIDSACYHGTHVAGIAAGRRNIAGAPVGGIAPDASIIAIRIFGVYSSSPYSVDEYCGDNPSGSTVTCVLAENTDMLQALQWVLANPTGIASVNFSVGGGGFTVSPSCDVYDPNLANAITTVRNSYKIATVVASGNEGLTNRVSMPACFSNAIAVGATNKSSTSPGVAYFSNTSNKVALFAPGMSIRSSVPSAFDSDGNIDGYQSKNGTSMSTPSIAGAFALMKQALPTESVTQLLDRLQTSGVSATDSKSSDNPKVKRQVPDILYAITQVAVTVPASVGYLSASAQYGYVYLTWPSVTGATSYKIINNLGQTVADVTSSTNAYNVPTTPYSNYYFGVSALNNTGSSGIRYSNTVQAKPSNSQVGYTFFAPNGAAVGLGSASPSTSGSLGANVVGGSSNRYSNGAWAVSSEGGVYSYGYAGFYGSMSGQRLNQPMISIASTASSNGYWMVASDGGIFSFGDAQFFGSTGSIRLNKPIVGMAPTPSGNGYWMVASDGGIFSFGDAQFFGSTGSIRLNKPIVGMTPTPSGNGYWMVASDGGIFAFGDAQFVGSLGGTPLNSPVIGMKRNDAGSGYWIFTSAGGVYSFGSAPFLGHGAGRGLSYVQAG